MSRKRARTQEPSQERSQQDIETKAIAPTKEELPKPKRLRCAGVESQYNKPLSEVLCYFQHLYPDPLIAERFANRLISLRSYTILRNARVFVRDTPIPDSVSREAVVEILRIFNHYHLVAFPGRWQGSHFMYRKNWEHALRILMSSPDLIKAFSFDRCMHLPSLPPSLQADGWRIADNSVRNEVRTLMFANKNDKDNVEKTWDWFSLPTFFHLLRCFWEGGRKILPSRSYEIWKDAFEQYANPDGSGIDVLSLHSIMQKKMNITPTRIRKLYFSTYGRVRTYRETTIPSSLKSLLPLPSVLIPLISEYYLPAPYWQQRRQEFLKITEIVDECTHIPKNRKKRART